MEQLSFFNYKQHVKLPEDILQYIPGFFNVTESLFFTESLKSKIPWKHQPITMYGKRMLIPRLTSWHGDGNKRYGYSGNKFDSLAWTPELSLIKEKIELPAGIRFNSVLLNYYRDGNDSMAWHSDDETELGNQPVIASVSFGQPRRFDVRSKADKTKKISILLEDGSLLLMKGNLQHDWEHRIAKSTVPMTPRINLTFRVII